MSECRACPTDLVVFYLCLLRKNNFNIDVLSVYISFIDILLQNLPTKFIKRTTNMIFHVFGHSLEKSSKIKWTNKLWKYKLYSGKMLQSTVHQNWIHNHNFIKLWIFFFKFKKITCCAGCIGCTCHAGPCTDVLSLGSAVFAMWVNK